MTTTGSNIHPDFVVYDHDHDQRTDIISGWTVEDVRELEAILDFREWCIGEEYESTVDTTEEDLRILLKLERERANKAKQSALEKKIKQYQKLKEELGL